MGNPNFVDVMGGYGYFCDSLRGRTRPCTGMTVVIRTDGGWMSRMLAESLSLFTEISEAALAWSAFVVLSGACAAVLPTMAWLLRRRLPAARSSPVALPQVSFGSTQKSLHSPRHAVLQHRTLMTTVLVCVLAVLVLPGLSALRSLGISVLQVGIGLVLPAFVVALHARQRDSTR